MRKLPVFTDPASGVMRIQGTPPTSNKSSRRSCIISVIRAPVKAHIHGPHLIASLFEGDQFSIPSSVRAAVRIVRASSSVKPVGRALRFFLVKRTVTSLAGLVLRRCFSVAMLKTSFTAARYFCATVRAESSCSCRRLSHQSEMLRAVTSSALSCPTNAIRLSTFCRKSPTVRAALPSAMWSCSHSLNSPRIVTTSPPPVPPCASLRGGKRWALGSGE